MLHIGRDRVQLIDLRVDVCEASRRLRTAATTTPLAGKMADRLQEHRGPKCRDRQQKRRVRSFASSDEIENFEKDEGFCWCNAKQECEFFDFRKNAPVLRRHTKQIYPRAE
jgi:hypothetical protein